VEFLAVDPFDAALRKVRNRLLLLRWISLTTQALVWGGVAACLWLTLTRLFPVLGPAEWPAALAMGVAAALATGLALWNRPSTINAALEADNRLGLRERLTSSLELDGVDAPMVQELHADARSHVSRINVGRDFPVKPPRALRWVAAPAVAFLLIYTLMPEWDLLGHNERVAEARAKAQETQIKVDRLRAVAKPLREQPAEESLDELDAAAENLERIAEALTLGDITEKQAYSRLENLSDILEKTRENLSKESPIPKLQGDPDSLNQMATVAEALKNGDFNEAAKALKEVQQKMASGDLSEAEKKALSDDLKQLAKMLGGEESMLGDALAEAAENLSASDMQAAIECLNQAELSMADLKSVLQQMAKLDSVCNSLGECKSLMLGKRASSRPGRGRGNQIGELPDSESTFEPTMLPGDMTKGKVLATFMQRAVPDEDAEASIDFSSEAITVVKQQAEHALTQEEIPPGAREFVRQYFGTLEPDGAAQGETQEP
jgi:hypothetical protein